MSAQPVIMAEARTEVPFREASGTKGRWRIKLIEADVQGSSGYYPAEVLKRDGAKAFPAGTQVFADHPTESEQWERPERSVRDLVGVTLGDAQYEEGDDGRGLFATMQVFPNFKDLVEAWGDHVGMSIRALGLRDENGHVTELIRGESVDIVTRAGAGGRLVAMTESARGGTSNGTPVEPKPLYTELTEADKNAMVTLNENMGKLAQIVEGLATKITQLEEKAAAVEQADVLSAGQVFAKLSDTDLPPSVKTKLADGYKKGVDLDAQIAEQKAIVDEIRASLGQGSGDGAPPQDGQGQDGGEGGEQSPLGESARGVGNVHESNNDTKGVTTALLSNLFGV